MHPAAILADVGNLAPEAPPVSDRFFALLGFFTWLHLLLTVAAVVCVCAQLVWERGNGNRGGYTTAILRAAVASVVVVSVGALMESMLH